MQALNNLLITGLSGTIGTGLGEYLLKTDTKFTGIDRRPNEFIPDLNNQTISHDLLDPAIPAAPFAPDFLIHLAANARVYELVENPQLAFENVQTIFNTLEYARKQGIKRFIFASSREVYGNQPVKPDSENSSTPVAPTPEPQTHLDHTASAYSASKFAGEAFVRAYCRCYGIDFIIFRFSNVYGRFDFSDRVLPLFIQQARANTPLTIFGADKLLDFTYLDDAIQGIIQALQNFESAKNQTYNLAFGQGNSLKHLAELITTATSSSSEIRIKPSRTGEVKKYIADISAAQQNFAYQPKTGLNEGVKKAVAWYNLQ